MFLSLLTSLLIFAVTPLTSANCTTFTDTRSLADTGSSFSNEFEQVVDILTCPSKSNETCMFPRKSYDITIPRYLNISASPSDADNIFSLAQQYYGIGSRNYTAPPFITRNTTISTTNTRQASDLLLEVEPGKNKSLVWVPYMLYSFGNLGGCSNTSLDGVGVRAAAPYLTNDTNNNTVIAGGWGAFTSNITNDGNAARSLKSSGTTAAFVGTAAALFALVL
ncbi:uncharacterized protein LY89DRAFT_686605 [Mollisia scopiformis]|uniref:Uncharacterized protein n=1 Tax=Mollisia scopiformis TaxID=149040 RepID=A0A194X5F0_MOLSC|nr:uncharacterized protein LY89DRAFT_686605 [Mollisia scopiformis]KUJ15042.1 hypothetical protein LY89DRAFT_686605 [Mollisia scopiformis]